MSPRPSKRLDLVTNNVWEWLDEVSAESEAVPVVNMGLGHIEFSPPKYLIRAYKDALDRADVNQYGPTLGRQRLKAALSKAYSPLYRRKLDTSQEICITSGGTAGLSAIMMAFLEEGDEVVVMEPCFNLYLYLIQFAHAKAVPVQLRPASQETESEANDWTVSTVDIENAITKRTKILIINTPHNPLGKVFSSSELREIGDVCVRHGVTILSDEVYEHAVFDDKFPRMALQSEAIAERTLTVGSVGKSFNATGWRVGYVIGPRDLIPNVQMAQALLAYTASGPAQEAAAIGFESSARLSFWEGNRQTLKSKVELFCSAMDDLGLAYTRPSAAKFVFVDMSTVHIELDTGIPSILLQKPRDWLICWFVTKKLGVSCVPGSAFYASIDRCPHCFIRFTVCKRDDELRLAIARLETLKSLIHSTKIGEIRPTSGSSVLQHPRIKSLL